MTSLSGPRAIQPSRRMVLGGGMAAATGFARPAAAAALDRAQAIAGWRQRINQALSSGTIPIIDTEYTYNRRVDMDFVVRQMDRHGVAQICFAPGDGLSSEVSLDLFRRFPERIVPTTKDASSPEWYANRTTFAAKLGRDIATGDYLLMGEFELRHYPSPQQYRAGRMDRDVDVSLDDPAVRQVMALAERSGIAVQIHYEVEDRLLPPLEALLARHPRAKVIWCHLGQVRFRERSKVFGPAYVEALLARFPNLHFDLGLPGPPHYHPFSAQRDQTLYIATERGRWGGYLDPAWKAVLERHPQRFLAASDLDAGRYQDMAASYARLRELVLDRLNPQARRLIAFENAWRLLTGTPWMA
jgi:predicted TIM-barrel fold metal-dependent hydrolase